jgi:adenylosuccinate lyase
LETGCTAQFSGAVGNYTIITPDDETRAAQILGLNVEKVSTQVIPRDHLAKLVSINALLASAIERIATEIRHLHRSEVTEVQEGFRKGQKGSSIMPHKKNPIAGENLTGIARVIRSHLDIALENIVLWHERDISHSSAERLYLPDHLGLTLYALTRLNETVNRLEFNIEIIENRVFDHFTYLSSFFLHHLLVHSDLTREAAYEIIQTSVFNTTNANDFISHLRNELKKRKISDHFLQIPTREEIKFIYLKHIDKIFSRFRS